MPGKENTNREHEEFKGTGSHNDNHGKNMVTIYVNDEAVAIHRGRQTVAEIKALGNVPATDILYQMPNYEVPLNDNDAVTIKGGERFKSCAPSGSHSSGITFPYAAICCLKISRSSFRSAGETASF